MSFIALIKRGNPLLTVFTHYNVVFYGNSGLVNWQELPLYDLLMIYSLARSSRSQYFCDNP